MIFVANKRRKLDRIQNDYPGAKIFDITSSAPTLQGKKLSPFYPHGNIPIPGDSRNMTATCVEAIWQGLKVFEGEGIDMSMFLNDTMHNIKRTVRKFGRPLGHQYGVFSKQILNGNKKSLSCVQDLPLDKIFLETDAPFQTLKGESFTNPSEIQRIYAAAAEIKKMSLESFCNEIGDNFKRIFYSL